ncbi:MAG: UvrD-helicase domain-containing protein [Oscillospiraceae bacterium]|nr:UvrD-helicase domain-containing protein [Oscillospiraceae bacterium]
MNSEFLELRKKIIKKDFSQLSDMQLKAVLQINGPLLILAGAGSGKTTVLINRISNIIKYGEAYVSDKICASVSDSDINLLEDYLDGKTDKEFEPNDILAVNPAQPWQILAITFTNKAANELKDRLCAKLGDKAKDIWAGTFHSICARILRRNSDILGYTSRFTIYDTDDSKRVMKECQRLLKIEDRLLSHKTILKEISKAKDSLITPEEYAKSAGNDIRLKNIAQAYFTYQQLLKTADAMDFDDIIMNTVSLLQKDSDACEYYQNKFRYILVDEYQDTNHAQYVLTNILAKKHNNICVVGDDDQSIYRFRGATIENILNFENQYKKANIIRLEQNYRSTGNILKAANAVISNNSERKGKTLWTANGDGEKITVYTANDEMEEGMYIADNIMSSVAAGGKWSDHAVFYRMNAQSNAIERSFVRSGIPYRVIGGHRFYDRKEIRDALAYLTLINNPSDNIRLRRIINEPKRGIGDATLNTVAEIAAGLGVCMFDVIKTADEYERLSRTASKLLQFAGIISTFSSMVGTVPISDLFTQLMDKSGYITGLSYDKDTFEDRLENINELSSNLLRYTQENEDADLGGFLEEVSLMSDIDNYNAGTDAVVLMTLHSAKGLEFPSVFMTGMEQGVFPGIQSMYPPSEIEEERRLAYVGITRAKERLYMTNVRARMLFGTTTRNRPSMFLLEIPLELTRGRIESGYFEKPDKNKYEREAKPSYHSKANHFVSSKQNALKYTYNKGDTVTHRTFGTGVVLVVQPMGNDTLLEIAFDKAGTKKLMANFAKLNKE